MILKRPLALDISHYEEVADFSKITPKPFWICCKASEGTGYTDDKFYRFMDGIKDAGIFRGAYHFYRKAYSPADQALLFIRVCNDAGIDEKDVLVLDVEEEGNSALSLKIWLEAVQNAFPDNLLMIYSRANILNAIANQAYAEYFRSIPVWTAGYPNNPDAYPSVPSSYVPDPTRWGPVWIWQYSESGMVPGVIGNVDLNWLSAAFMGHFGDIAESWFDGTVSLLSGYQTSPAPFYFHLTRFKRSDVDRIVIPGYGFLGRATYFFDSRGKPHIVTNGGEGYYETSPVLPKGIGLSDGELFKSDTEQTNIQWSQSNSLLGIAWKKLPDAWNAIGISKIFLTDGIVNANLDNLSPDPRSVLAWNDDEYFLLHIDGRNNGTPGLGLLDTANFLKSLGATHAGNLDGGDSETLVYNNAGVPEIKNYLPDGTEHSVVNHVGFFLKVGEVTPPPDGGDMYNCTVVKATRVREAPSIFDTGYELLPVSYQFQSDTFRDVTETVKGVPVSGTWVQLPDGRWTAAIYKGEEFVECFLIVPPGEGATIVLTEADGTVRYFDERL